MKIVCCALIASVVAVSVPTWGQAPVPKKPTPEEIAAKAAEAAKKTAFVNAKTAEITDQIKSKDAAENKAGIAALKEWIATEKTDAVKAVLAVQTAMLWDPRSIAELPDILDSVQAVQKDPPFIARNRLYKGYALIQLGKKDEGNALIKKMFQDHPNESATVASTDILNGLKNQKKNAEVMDLSMQLICAKPDNAEMVERLIKMRVGMLNANNQGVEALAELKSLFNACTMNKTADTLTAMDQQLRLMYLGQDQAPVDQFRTEQKEGAVPPAPGAEIKKNTIMFGIKVKSDVFDAALDVADASTFQGMQQRCVLMLLADKPDEAMKWAKRAYGEANNPPQAQTAKDLIARSLKCTDGNVGRAVQWMGADAPKK